MKLFADVYDRDGNPHVVNLREISRVFLDGRHSEVTFLNGDRIYVRPDEGERLRAILRTFESTEGGRDGAES